MRTFDYARPRTLDEALGQLGQDGVVRPLAGGTDLLTLMKADLAAPERLVDLKRIDAMPSGIDADRHGLTLGALVTLGEIESNPAIRRDYTALAEAAALAATPQLRNMATIGGNLLQRPRCWYFRNSLFHCWLKGGEECHARDGENQLHALFGSGPCVAVHPSDPATALAALGAEVRLRGPQGERTLPVAELFAMPTEDRRTETTLGSDELLLSVTVPPQEGWRSTYLKAMDRKVWAFALAGAAVALRIEGRRVAEARVVLGGVAPIPWRVEAAERALVGKEPDARAIDAAADAAVAGAQPLAKNGYKVPLARALVRRALRSLLPLGEG